jgi:phosphate:Na+ symporter
MGTIVLLDLMGGVALLLWGLHMVQSGAMRAFGSDLRRLLAQAFRNRFAAFGVGLALTAVLQSSTLKAWSAFPHWRSCWGRTLAQIVQILSFNVAAAALRRPWPWRMHPARRCAWAMR